MLEGNTDEIRMEISSCFVKTHEYWEKRRGGRNWEPICIGRETVFRLEDFHISEIYEKTSMYTAGASKCVHVRGAYECREIAEGQVILRCVTQDEVIEGLQAWLASMASFPSDS